MGNYKTKSIMVYDNGLFVESAIKLAKTFGKVYYYSPWKSGFPKSNPALVGYGIEEIHRVNNFFDHVKDVDCFYFPDIYDGDLQVYLKNMGYPVFGSAKGEEMELEKDSMKEHMKSIGLPVGPYEVIIGLKDLRTYLKEKNNVFVKCNCFRGDFETFKSESYELSEPLLDKLEWDLGAKKYITKFIVEDDLKDKVETGCDTYNINGEYPNLFMSGIEIKDRGYVAVVKEKNQFPDVINNFNDTIAPTLKEYGYQGWMSTEIRVGKDNVGYMIDFCARSGSPPNELYQEMYTNIDDIIWEGAHGRCVDPVVPHRWGVEALIHSQWADKNWQAIYFPEEIRSHVKLRNLCKIKNDYYVVPQSVGLPEIGTFVVTGDSFDEAVGYLKNIEPFLKGHDIDIKIDALDKAQEEMEKLKEFNINVF